MTIHRQCGRALALLLGAVAVAALSPRSLAAQYFGQNKVQYQTFDFQVMETPHFDVYYYPEEEVAARDAARMAERWYARLSNVLDHEFELRQPVVLYGSHPAFQQTTTLSGDIGEGTGGVTEAFKQRVIMPLAGSYQETDHVMGHELVHAFQYDISGLGRFRGSIGAGGRAFGSAPLWFTEGMAEYLSVGPIDALTAMWMRDAVLTGNLPTHEQLNRDPRFFPYRWGQSLWAYVGGRWGDPTIGQILRLVGQGIPYPQAFERVLAIELDDLIADWHVAIRRAYLPMLPERQEAREAARPLITEGDEGGTLNIGPSISPDGRYVTFISELDFIDAELHLADARTGEHIRRLQRGAAFDSHYQSLRYISSAGTWAPDSRRFAFSALRAGSDVLVLMDVERANVIREVRIDNVSEISTPNWSPDGRSIVFSGIQGGVSNLYIYDVESEQTRQLTDDLYASFHPAYSPDGSLIAYITEEGPGTDLEMLTYSPYRVMLIDPVSGEKQVVARMDEGSNINPQWSRDGASLYFVSDRTGIPNIFRVALESGELYQVTDLFGGVSGITATSPALTVARNDDRILFSAYEERNYNIYALSGQSEITGTLVTDPIELSGGAPLPAHLPPLPRPQQGPFTRVANTIADELTGLPTSMAAAQWEIRPYRPRLTLDYLGQPQVGVSVGGYAGQGGLYGAVSGIFSDLLGHHTVMAAVQAQGQYDEVGFQTVYLNQARRWNWGGAAQRVPYIMLGQEVECEGGCPANGTATVNLDFIRLRLFDSSLMGMIQYPFSRAMRVEASAGVRRISQDAIIDRLTGPAILQGGFLANFQPQVQDRFKDDRYSVGYNMGQASLALVYDNTLFGYTSPFAGQRYRFEVTPVLGELNFIQAMADYRRYLFFRPFTVAVRGLHMGQYGEDDAIFGRRWMGYPYYMRGYYSAYNDCRDQTLDGCRLYQSMLGTRIAVVNAELRFPLIRALVIGPIGFPPIEGVAFYDAGVAWDRETNPVFRRGANLEPGERGILSSTGVGARINLLGFAVMEVDYVKPLDSDRDWHWQFSFQPGF